MSLLNCHKQGIIHTIDRRALYQDVLSLYSERMEEVIGKYPFRVQFKDEIGVDLGGVSRDFFSAFFMEAYLTFLMVLISYIHASVDMAIFSILGVIISHGYLTAGIFPD